MEIQATQAAEPSQDASAVDMYLAAPNPLKSRARKAIGARNDDEAIQLINSDGKAASVVLSIVSAQDEVLASGNTEMAPEDVLYPRAK